MNKFHEHASASYGLLRHRDDSRSLQGEWQRLAPQDPPVVHLVELVDGVEAHGGISAAHHQEGVEQLGRAR